MSTVAKKHFQILVIGGGINGTGIAREAAYRGFTTLLVEQGDFAQATSMQSSKLIHGGIRYLENRQLKLVFEALHERQILLKIAPHLVHPLRFHIPVYKGDSRPPWKIQAGCKLYDALSGHKNLEASEKIPKEKWKKFPGLQKEGLKALFAYSDAQTFDSRLTLETALSAKQAGAEVHNYTSFQSVEKMEDHYQITVKDERTDTEYQVTAQTVINAAGAWAPRVDKLFTEGTKRPELKLVRGIHLLLPKLQDNHGFLTLPKGGRIVFVLPWQGFTLVGTTESLYEGKDLLHIPPSEEEIQYLLDVLKRYFPTQKISRGDILHTYAGVRPLIDMGEKALSKMSREYHFEAEIQSGNKGYIALFGGKITTYRLLGEKIINEVCTHFQPANPAYGCTKTDPLVGAKRPTLATQDYLQEQLETAGFQLAHVWGWMRSYNAGWEWIARRFLEVEASRVEILPGLFQAELEYLKEVEMAYQIEDYLLRRTLKGLHLSPEERQILEKHFPL